MRLFLAYLWRSPLIRMTTVWFLLAIIGVSLFSFKLLDMRSQLVSASHETQGYIKALQKTEAGQTAQINREIQEIIEEVEKFRPTVSELLDFVKQIEDIANEKQINLQLRTLEKSPSQPENTVRYKLSFSASLKIIENFINSFEKLPYATKIDSIDIKQTETTETETTEAEAETNTEEFILTLIFTLFTKFS